MYSILIAFRNLYFIVIILEVKHLVRAHFKKISSQILVDFEHTCYLNCETLRVFSN